ncbi:recombinase family protein [Rhodococcus triatomae]|nr:recombinase [Rhodococcus triatomae BKS 15-14]
MRVAIYARISADPSGNELGVGRQLEDCRTLVDQLKWEPVDEFVDNDLSASSGVVRPEYERLLADVEAGAVDAIVAWHPDRLYRRTSDLERLILVAEAHGVTFRTVMAGDIDLSTASGRMVARMLGAASTHEVERARERMVRAHLQAAMNGKWRLRKRAFGWTLGGVELVEEEAEAIRKAARHVLTGGSVRSVVREWNESGLQTAGSAAKFDGTAIREILTSPRVAGLATYKGRIVGPGQWPAILSEDEHRGLVAVFSNRARRRSRTYERKHQGSGVYRCSECPATVHVHQDGKGRQSYRCSESPGHPSRRVETLDAYIADLVIGRLSKSGVFDQLFAPSVVVDLDALHAERSGLEERLSELTGLYAEGILDAEQLREGATTIREKILTVELRMGESQIEIPDWLRSGTAEIASVPALRQRWEATSADRRGKIIGRLLDVSILRSPSGRRRFCPEFVLTEWKLPEILEPKDAAAVVSLLAPASEVEDDLAARFAESMTKTWETYTEAARLLSEGNDIQAVIEKLGNS